MSERYTTPVGRLVQGDCFTANDKDMDGNLRVVKSGPNMGQPAPQFYVGLAFPKTPGVTDWKQEPDPFFQTIARIGQQSWPQGQHTWPTFAWKVIDGDSAMPNRRGKAPNTIEGFRGNWVVRFNSGYPIKCYPLGRHEAKDQIQDKNAIRRGYYIRACGSIDGNGNSNNPGVYVNVDMVELCGYGQEIITGPEAKDAFAAPVALPPGASATPVLPSAQMTGGPAMPPVAAPPPVASVTPPPPAAPPYTGFIPTPIMLPAANGIPYESYKASGWTDEQLIANGMMAA